MSSPAYPYIPEAFETQNVHDDDAQVIDSLFEETSAPADIKAAVVATDPVQQYKAKAPTRMFANTISFPTGYASGAVRLLSEDVDRGTTYVRVVSSAAAPAFNDYVIVSDDLNKVSAGFSGIAIPVHNNGILDLSGHTGQVWVIPGPALSSSSVIEVCAYGIASADGTQLNNV
jgi:hypothetical protein